MTDLTAIATDIRAALDAPHQIAPAAARGVTMDIDSAYDVAARVAQLGSATRVGRKIGFTNRAIWPVFNVDQPVWAAVTDTSLINAAGGAAEIDLPPYPEPRIEPELVLGLRTAPRPGMTRAALMDTVDWVAPGFEIVQSIYPDWSFALVDTIAAGGLHGALVLGPKVAATPELLGALPDISVSLRCNGKEVETGTGANALDGPLDALAHLVDLLDGSDAKPDLEAGECISTGTLTNALTIAPGETWEAVFTGAFSSRLSLHLR